MVTRWSGETKYRALLAVAQAAHSRRDLSSVLDAVAGALESLMRVDLLALVAHEGEGPRPLAAYLRSRLLVHPGGGAEARRSGEGHGAFVRRLAEAIGSKGEAREHAMMRQVVERERRTLVFNDVQGDPRLEGSLMRRTGAECEVVLPLTMGDEFVCVLVAARMSLSPFSPDEVSILEDVAGPVATAVANAIAFEEIQRLRSRLEDENLALREEITTAAAAGGIIGTSPGLREVLDRVGRVAATDSTVLISGETGTGKELIARAIHAGSQRAKRALVKVNCAALPEGLIGSELFGHEKGAFTGAMERRRGRFELAAGGTIFLDEVGELPAPVQVSLLRVLQEHEFERVGGSETLRTDARVVAATNRNLEEVVRDGRFRTDLFFRLNVFPIRIPPLRERAEDIPLLAEYWASSYAKRIGKEIRGIGEAAMAALCAYPWPGNIRELQNVVERAVILARGSMLDVSDFELPVPGSAPGRRSPSETARRGSDGPADERRQIEDALAASRGRVYGAEGAAETLGVPPSTLEARIRRLAIDKHAFRRRVPERQ